MNTDSIPGITTREMALGMDIETIADATEGIPWVDLVNR